ncbi:unnamed protein product, partial [Owenia fusiformis]
LLEEVMAEPDIQRFIKLAQPNVTFSGAFNWNKFLTNIQLLTTDFPQMIQTFQLPTFEKFFNLNQNLTDWLAAWGNLQLPGMSGDPTQDIVNLITQAASSFDGVLSSIP